MSKTVNNTDVSNYVGRLPSNKIYYNDNSNKADIIFTYQVDYKDIQFSQYIIQKHLQ